MLKLRKTAFVSFIILVINIYSPLLAKNQNLDNVFSKGRGGNKIVLLKNGKAKMKILVAPEVLPLNQKLDLNTGKSPINYVFKEEISGVSEQRLAVIKIIHYIKKMTGVELDVKTAKKGDNGIYIGRSIDFPWLKENVDTSTPESFIVKSKKKNLYLLGNTSLGVRAAVIYFLKSEGCRWYFPGEAWKVVPSKTTISGSYNIQKKPAYDMARTFWYSFAHLGMPSKAMNDYDQWYYFNGMGGPIPMRGGHSLYGIDIEKAKYEHPDWFAEVNGSREFTGHPNHAKFCYSNPEVVKQMKKFALEEADKKASALNLSPADGANFCECERCQSVAGGVIDKSIRQYALMAVRPDGDTVCVTSETYFKAVNEVAKVVRKKHPSFLVISYAYSSYAHPPTFDMEPNVVIMTTTHFRYTPLSFEDQLTAWGKKAKTGGIRAYWSVGTWDYEKPYMGEFNPEQIRKDLLFYNTNNITGFNTEASNNWGPRGLSYYIGSNLLWDTNTDIKALASDFYHKAFGPAASAMEKYYVRFYGPSVLVSERGIKLLNTNTHIDEAEDGKVGEYVFVQEDSKIITISKRTLKDGFQLLDEAIKLVNNDSKYKPYRDRIDHLRMYFYYLLLREQLQVANETKDNDKIVKALQDMTEYSMRLFETNMIHSFALAHRYMFDWYSKPYAELLKDIPEAKTQGEGWRKIGVPPPTHNELNILWNQGMNYLGIH